MRRCAAAIARAVVAFLDAVLVGCFLACFRPCSDSGSGCRGALVPGDQEEGVLSDDGQDGLGRIGRSFEGLKDGGVIDEEFRLEANYLKLCGTITETPAELQNESCDINLENANECNNVPTNAQATDCTFLSESNSSEGCINEEQYILSPDLNIDDARDLPGVESVPHAAFIEKTPSLNSKNKLLDRSVSPFPTPSDLKDDMETPGTIYTSHRRAPVSGKLVRTRKEFIYPVLRPIENELHHMELIEDTSAFPLPNTLKGRNLGADSSKKPKQTSSTSVAQPGFRKSPLRSSADDNVSYQEKEAQFKCQIGNVERMDEGSLSKSNSDEKHAALSLSHWLRPSSTDNENQGDVKCATGGQSYDEDSPLTDRPVFKASDQNWDVENPTPRLPKTWDGNGIPNTNTRYKEDKKVTWHATPFEERLLKVLSDEEVRPGRVARGKLFHPEEKAG